MLRKQRRYPLLHRLAVYRWNKGTQIPFVPAFSGRTVWPQRLVPRALMHLVNSDCLLKFRVLLVLFSKGNVPRSHVYNASQKRNPVHSITLYWPDFQSHNAHWNLMIFKKKPFQNIVVRGFTLLLTPFESKLRDYVMSTDRLNVWRNRHFDHFLSKMLYLLYFAKSSKTDSS